MTDVSHPSNVVALALIRIEPASDATVIPELLDV
jgi:hypothetical protein